MFKRMIGLCTAALMLVSLLPAAVWAEGTDSEQTAAPVLQDGAVEQVAETVEDCENPNVPEEPVIPETTATEEITVEDQGITVMAATSGTCGKNVTWSYSTSSRTLAISGSGEMDDFTSPPWSTSVRNVKINEGVTSIGNNAFTQMSELTSVTIPSTVTRIGNNAFAYCTSLASITIPASVTKIDYNAFLSCSGLKDVSFSGSMPTIASNAFQFCPKFTIHLTDPKTWVASNLYDSAANTWNGYPVSFSSDILYSGSLNANTSCSINSAGILTIIGEGELIAPTGGWTWASFSPMVYRIVLKGNITAIGNGIFCNMENLGVVELPDTLVTIGERAFKNCPKLTKVVIPQTTMTIGSEAFADCTGLETIQVNSWLCEAAEDAFEGCTALHNNGTFYGTRIYYAVQEAIDQHSGASSSYAPVDQIGSFSAGNAVVTYYKNGLCVVARYIGQNSGQVTTTVGNIGSSTFLYIGDGIDLIGSGAFQDKTSLRTIRFPENDLTIQSEAFQGCGFDQLDFGDNSYTYTLESNSFSQCPNLKSIDFGTANINMETVNSMTGAYQFGCFSWNKVLTEINFGTGLVKPGQSCFTGCTALTDVHITKNVVMDGSYSSGKNMFHNCSALKTAVIDCSFIPPFFFENDKALTSVTFSDPDVQFYWLEHDSNSGHMFNTDSKDWGSINLIGYECSQVSAFVDASNKRNSDPYINWPTLTFESIAGDSKTHTEVTDAAKAPTCKETGLTEGSHCSRCGKVFTAQTVIPTTEHTWDGGVVTTAATSSAEGVMTFTCTVCKETKTEAIPMLGTLPGDVNGDGKVDITDMALVYEYLTGQKVFDDGQKKAADVVNDGGEGPIVDVYDLQRLYEAVSGIRPF